MRLLLNAQIYTQDPNQPAAQALAVDGGRIVASGSNQDLLNRFGAAADQQDVSGCVIWPGLVDAHIHLDHYAASLDMIDCETSSQAECVRRVAERTAQAPTGKWVRGHGWNQNNWPEGFGSVRELDAVSPQNPVFLTAKSLHAAWANSAALRAAGISSSTPDPHGGFIQRDEQGRPTGILIGIGHEFGQRRHSNPHPGRNRPFDQPGTDRFSGSMASPACTTTTAAAASKPCKFCSSRGICVCVC